MIASGIVLIGTFIALLAFAFSTLLLYLKYPKSRAVKLLSFYFLFFFLGLIATSLRNKIPDFISLQLGVVAFAVGYMFLYMAIKNMFGLESKWHKRYYIPIVLMFVGIFLFTYIYYDLHIRIVIFSIYIAIYTFATAWLLYEESVKHYKRFHQFIALIYLIVSFVFMLRAVNAATFGYHLQVFYSTTFIVNSPYLSLIVMSLALIIMSNLHLRSDKK